jgi:hypothetical protein
MRRFELSTETFKAADLERQAAKEADALRWYREPGVYCDRGHPAIIYGQLDSGHDEMLWALRSIHYHQEKRTAKGSNLHDPFRRLFGKKDGLGKSRVFGFRPPIPYNPQGNTPALCSLSKDSPRQHQVICDFGWLMDSLYKCYAPEVYARHQKELESVLPIYRIPKTVFTSGIVNQNNPLKYHFDKGNFEGVLSCMVVFKNLVGGGNLIIPEFGAGFELADRSFFLFDGQRYLHGVTPVKKMNRSGYRYSVVYYSLRSMARCQSLEDELTKVRKNRMTIERNRL